MWKTSDGQDEGEFNGFLTVPNQPFRAAVVGMNTAGVAFRSVLATPFEPLSTGLIEQPILPPSLPATQTNQLLGMVAEYRRQLQTRAAQAVSEHPGGVITLARAAVSRITYEPLESTSGTPIGMRLRYSIQFPSRQTIVAVPHVFPVYQPWTWRGLVTMKTLGGTIAPAPQLLGVQSLQDVIIYRAAATYQSGTTYDFTVDMVPDYVTQGTQTGRFCIYEEKFSDRSVWRALIASEVPVPYSLSISDTNTSASIPVFFPQRTFYESFTAGGAFDCGPTPNTRF
jgi:hypothetical protein